jgi:thiamine-monophosphate kinase
MEQDLLTWLNGRTFHHACVTLGIGDDAAILAPRPGFETIVTTDMLMDRVDFLWGTHDPALIGRKCLAVNLSDLAAMAAKPFAAFVSLALPRSMSFEDAQRLMQGILELAKEFQVELAGGDTNTHDGPLVVNVVAMGETPHGRAWLRSGAKPGDRLVVTGPLGGSLKAKQFSFSPRVREALQWRELAEVHAAIDISDGFCLDLSRLLSASGCGALVREVDIPISDDAFAMSSAGSGKTPLEHALGDGEDFELILALPPSVARILIDHAQHNGLQVRDVGVVTQSNEILLTKASGEVEPLPAIGYLHRLST